MYDKYILKIYVISNICNTQCQDVKKAKIVYNCFFSALHAIMLFRLLHTVVIFFSIEKSMYLQH